MADYFVFDTQAPPRSPDHALGFAGRYDEARRAIVAFHVTNDAERVRDAVRAGISLLDRLENAKGSECSRRSG